MTSLAILGPGRHGTAIGALFAAHGVDVTLYHHRPQKAEAARQTIAAIAPAATVRIADTARDAVEGQSIVALTTLWDAPQRAVIAELGDALIGGVLLDVSNPLDVTPTGIVRRIPPQGSAGAFVATLLPEGVGQLKAFSNLATASILGGADRTPPAVLPFVASDAVSADAGRALLAQTGWLPRLVGTIADSASMEAGGAYNAVFGAYGKAQLTEAEFSATFGPEFRFA